MLAVSDTFLAALSSPQQVTYRADVDKAGTRLFSGLPILGGAVDVDASSITRRRLTLDLAPRMSGPVTSVPTVLDPFLEVFVDDFGGLITTPVGAYQDVPTLPSAPSDPLGHYGQEITVSGGLVYPDGVTEWVQLGVFRIDSAAGSVLGDGPVRVVGVSREAYIADARFTSPYTASSPSATSLIGTLIHEVLPSVEVVVSASMDRRVPRTTWDEDRWGAITDLAQSIAAVVYADPYGRFVIADAPTVSTPPVWTVAAGPGGVLVSADASSSRDGIYNRVVVRGESPSSDSPPVQGVATDTTATSATRWGDPADGAFGMVPYFMSLPNVTTTTQAVAIARANLARHLGAASTLDISTVPNLALEAGDVIDVVTDPSDPAGTVRRHAVDSFTAPLSPGGAFPIRTRDLRDASDA